MSTIKQKGTLAQRAFYKNPIILFIGQSTDVDTQVSLLKKNYSKLHPRKTLFINECGVFNPQTDVCSEWIESKILKVNSINKDQSWFTESFTWSKKIICDYTTGPLVITDFPKNETDVNQLTNFFSVLCKKVYVFYLQNEGSASEEFKTWTMSILRYFSQTNWRACICTIHVKADTGENNIEILNFLAKQ